MAEKMQNILKKDENGRPFRADRLKSFKTLSYLRDMSPFRMLGFDGLNVGDKVVWSSTADTVVESVRGKDAGTVREIRYGREHGYGDVNDPIFILQEGNRIHFARRYDIVKR